MSKIKPKNPSYNACSNCGASYRKMDFHICPHCGGDGGGRTPKEWRPSKKEQREFAKKKSAEGA